MTTLQIAAVETSALEAETSEADRVYMMTAQPETKVMRQIIT